MRDNVDEFDKMMSEIMAKKYAKESDQDLLERKDVIDGISKIIDDRLFSKQPLSLAITGIWGVGKSYILKEIENKYSARCIVFHYDCWKSDYYEEPLIGILSAISEQLNEIEAKNPDKQQKHYYKVMREVIFQISRGVIQNFTKYDIKKIRNHFVKFKKLLKSKKEIDIALFDSLSNVSDVIEVVNNLLCGYMAYEGKKILFVVDELDRCLPDYALKILNRLHHICYETPIIQLVAVNDKELVNNINGLYRRSDGSNFAYRYLQRFFTTFYRVPIGYTKKIVSSVWNDIDEYFYGKYSDKIFELFCDYALSHFPIREKQTLLTLHYDYHLKVMSHDHNKYPFELACAELIEVIRSYLRISSNWYLTSDISEIDAFDDLDFDDDGRPNPIYKENLFSVTIQSEQPFDINYISDIRSFLLTTSREKDVSPTSADESKNFVIAFFVKDSFDIKGVQPEDKLWVGRNVLQDADYTKSLEMFEKFKSALNTYE